ncbi:hypothetical protein NSA27_04025 [Clostridium tepidum]|uniref:hypothetical protein n=1 Tax=Clostridium tepidum TaxID=1962263 RepID=UPI002149C0FA|nr:hypothetical protein [Clostridium tepidum]MCR1933869.1 hypothetical protein [Clostridium tepidum]
MCETCPYHRHVKTLITKNDIKEGDKLNTLKNHFKQQLKRSGKQITINNNICSHCFFKEIKDKEYIDTKRMFIDKDVNVNQGDIIDCIGQKWIVIQQQENYNEVYSIYTVRRINNKLNFQFGDGVYSIYCIVEDSIQSVTGDIPIGDGKIQVITQANNITDYLVEQTRFLLYNNAYRVEGYTQTEKNIVKFYCKKGQIKTNIDDLENEIAYNEKLLKIYINNKYEIAMTGGSNLDLKENESKVIDIEFKKNNEVDTAPNVQYIYDKDLVKFDENTKTITAIKEGNTDLKIIYNNVEKIIKVNIQKTVYKIEVTSTDIKINKGQTATIEAKFYKDGVEDTNAVVEYTSNSINIATVDKGIITGVGAGNTTIVIRYNNVEKIINIVVEEVKTGLQITGADTHKVGRMQQYTIENPQNKDIKCTLNVDSSIAKIRETTNTSVSILATRDTNNIGKTYIIRVELLEDKNIFVEKEITLKPQF